MSINKCFWYCVKIIGSWEFRISFPHLRFKPVSLTVSKTYNLLRWLLRAKWVKDCQLVHTSAPVSFMFLKGSLLGIIHDQPFWNIFQGNCSFFHIPGPLISDISTFALIQASPALSVFHFSNNLCVLKGKGGCIKESRKCKSRQYNEIRITQYPFYTTIHDLIRRHFRNSLSASSLFTGRWVT